MFSQNFDFFTVLLFIWKLIARKLKTNVEIKAYFIIFILYAHYHSENFYPSPRNSKVFIIPLDSTSWQYFYSFIHYPKNSLNCKNELESESLFYYLFFLYRWQLPKFSSEFLCHPHSKNLDSIFTFSLIIRKLIVLNLKRNMEVESKFYYLYFLFAWLYPNQWKSS